MARAIKEECEGELAVAMPILEDALAALDAIKEADITYIRKLGNPPGAIKLVMEVSPLCTLRIHQNPACADVPTALTANGANDAVFSYSALLNVTAKKSST